VGLGQGHHSCAVGGVGQAQAGAVGDDDVGVVQESFDGCGGDGVRHDRVEPGRVEIRGDRDRSSLVGGVDDAVERWDPAGPRVAARKLCKSSFTVQEAATPGERSVLHLQRLVAGTDWIVRSCQFAPPCYSRRGGS